LGSDGQMAIGNDINHIKYYKDENNNYILDVRLNKLYLGTSQQTADQQFQGMVEISANNLTSVFKTSGGSNLLRNSVGYAGTDFWLTAGNITTNQNDDMSLSGSEFILTNDASLEQIYSTQPGTLYSIAFKYKHTVDLYIIWSEKVNFLNESIEKNYFNSKYFFWVDAGLFRDENKKQMMDVLK